MKGGPEAAATWDPRGGSRRVPGERGLTPGEDEAVWGEPSPLLGVLTRKGWLPGIRQESRFEMRTRSNSSGGVKDLLIEKGSPLVSESSLRYDTSGMAL